MTTGAAFDPLDPAHFLRPRRDRDFAPDSIGVLIRPLELAAWEERVRTRFRFLGDLDDDAVADDPLLVWAPG